MPVVVAQVALICLILRKLLDRPQALFTVTDMDMTPLSSILTHQTASRDAVSARELEKEKKSILIKQIADNWHNESVFRTDTLSNQMIASL